LRRNIAELERWNLELEKKYTFSMEMYESMMRRVTDAEISHWGQGPKYPPGTCWIHWEYR